MVKISSKSKQLFIYKSVRGEALFLLSVFKNMRSGGAGVPGGEPKSSGSLERGSQRAAGGEGTGVTGLCGELGLEDAQGLQPFQAFLVVGTRAAAVLPLAQQMVVSARSSGFQPGPPTARRWLNQDSVPPPGPRPASGPAQRTWSQAAKCYCVQQVAWQLRA